MVLTTIIRGTLREASAKKTLVGFFIFSSLMILVAVLVLQMEGIRDALFQPAGKDGPGGDLSRLVAATILDRVWTGVSALLMFMTIAVGVFSTAGFTTSLMEKGAVDLYLSKPVHRWEYILSRYLGAVMIMAFQVAYLIAGLWIVVGATTGSWKPEFLVSIPYITVGFAGIYAIVQLVGVLTRSSFFATTIGIALYFLTNLMLPLAEVLDRLLSGQQQKGWVSTMAEIVNYVMPQLSGLAHNMTKIIVGDVTEGSPVLATLGLGALYLALTAWVFEKKEF